MLRRVKNNDLIIHGPCLVRAIIVATRRELKITRYATPRWLFVLFFPVFFFVACHNMRYVFFFWDTRALKIISIKRPRVLGREKSFPFFPRRCSPLMGAVRWIYVSIEYVKSRTQLSRRAMSCLYGGCSLDPGCSEWKRSNGGYGVLRPSEMFPASIKRKARAISKYKVTCRNRLDRIARRWNFEKPGTRGVLSRSL